MQVLQEDYDLTLEGEMMLRFGVEHFHVPDEGLLEVDFHIYGINRPWVGETLRSYQLKLRHPNFQMGNLFPGHY